MLISEFEGTQPLFLDKGCGGARELEEDGGRRRFLSVLTLACIPSTDSDSPGAGCVVLDVKGLATPGTANLKLNGNGIMVHDVDDSPDEYCKHEFEVFASARGHSQYLRIIKLCKHSHDFMTNRE